MFKNIEYQGFHHLAIGRIGEYWTKLALTLNGLDVYTTEVAIYGIAVFLLALFYKVLKNSQL